TSKKAPVKKAPAKKKSTAKKSPARKSAAKKSAARKSACPPPAGDVWGGRLGASPAQGKSGQFGTSFGPGVWGVEVVMPATADVRVTRARANGRNGDDGDGALLADVLEALDALGKGDFTVRLPVRADGRAGQMAKAFNRVADLNARLNKDLGRVGRVVGREGRMTERLNLEGAGGSWTQSVDSVNRLIDDLVRPTNEVARVLQAV